MASSRTWCCATSGARAIARWRRWRAGWSTPSSSRRGARSYQPERDPLQDEGHRQRSGEGADHPHSLDERGEDDEEGTEAEEPSEQPAQRSRGRTWPVLPVGEDGEDAGVDGKGREEAAQPGAERGGGGR